MSSSSSTTSKLVPKWCYSALNIGGGGLLGGDWLLVAHWYRVKSPLYCLSLLKWTTTLQPVLAFLHSVCNISLFTTLKVPDCGLHNVFFFFIYLVVAVEKEPRHNLLLGMGIHVLSDCRIPPVVSAALQTFLALARTLLPRRLKGGKHIVTAAGHPSLVLYTSAKLATLPVIRTSSLNLDHTDMSHELIPVILHTGGQALQKCSIPPPSHCEW